MNPSSPVGRAASQRVAHRAASATNPARECRRDRQHLYPLEEYQDALAIGGVVRSFCGLEVALLSGDTSDVVEATEPDAGDCVSCVDIWRESTLVRL
jgi:hypothetical protein